MHTRSSGEVTKIFVTKVDQAQVAEYKAWLDKIHKVESTFPGFQRVYVQAPIDNLQDTWITLLQFDTQKNLDSWLYSDVRKAFLSDAESIVSSLESHHVVAPFEGWFAKDAPHLSLWKQTMLVLLVLFPIVMLELKYLNPLLANLPYSVGIFIGNVLSVSLITWPGLPLCLKFLDWWLKPNNRFTNIAGTLFIIALYLVEIALFWK